MILLQLISDVKINAKFTCNRREIRYWHWNRFFCKLWKRSAL